MKLKITKCQPEWSEVKHGKRVVIVEFPNCEFKWMPAYHQLKDIEKALKEIEVESWKAPIIFPKLKDPDEEGADEYNRKVTKDNKAKREDKEK